MTAPRLNGQLELQDTRELAPQLRAQGVGRKLWPACGELDPVWRCAFLRLMARPTTPDTTAQGQACTGLAA
jgi:hypothetical protein